MSPPPRLRKRRSRQPHLSVVVDVRSERSLRRLKLSERQPSLQWVTKPNCEPLVQIGCDGNDVHEMLGVVKDDDRFAFGDVPGEPFKVRGGDGETHCSCHRGS